MTNVDKFILVNLEDNKSKELAQVISSDTSRKILNLLSEKSYAETDIAKKLDLPLSTVHYNVQALLKSNIIEIKDFLWSEKGKKINIYQLANKLIIIAPKQKDQNEFLDKVKGILPVAVFGVLGTFGLFIYENFSKVNNIAYESVQEKMTNEATAESLTMVANAPQEAIKTASPDIAFWFGIGALSMVLLYVVYSYIIYLRKKSKKLA